MTTNGTRNSKQSLLSKTGLCIILLMTITCGSLYHIHHLTTSQQQLSYQAEALYQRNFGELTTSIQTIHRLLAQLLVTSDKEQLLYGLSTLWREIYTAIHSLGLLPIAMHELEQTDLLLYDMAEYSYYLMKKNVLSQEPLAESDWERLETFYQRTNIVYTELESLETAILSENFFLTKISLDDETNPIHTAFQSIEKQISTFPAIEFEEGVRKLEPEPHFINGTQIDQKEAIYNANNFLMQLQIDTPDNLLYGEIAFVTASSRIPVYCVSYPENHYIEVSQRGGNILQYYHVRDLTPAALTAEQAETQAYQILQKLQISDVICVERKIDNYTASFVFVPVQENMYLYPDMITLQLALDDGALLSFDQSSYQARHQNRMLPSPAITEADVLKNRNPNFKINSVHFALITDPYSQKEVLTYELRGSIINEQFAIFIDAQTGKELRIVHL